MVAKSNFLPLTDLVIKNFEGGYYHPEMMRDGRLKYDPRYATSGETMLGIDRKNGASLAGSPAWKEFWGIIDQAGARTKWKWNYLGGALAPKLRLLAAEIMFPHFSTLYSRYLSSGAQTAVKNDPRLILHFSYAAWNGPGWFSRFANTINNAVKEGKTGDQLAAAALNSRTGSSNSLIRQSGAKMVALFKTLPGSPGGAGFNPLALLLALFF